MDPIETFKVDDKVVKIYYDEDPLNPRDPENQDNCDLFICFHWRYQLGDKHNYKTSDYKNWGEIEAQIIKDLKPVEIRRLYLYDHSGITISDSPFSCSWDSGKVGFALITRESALKEMGAKKVTKKIKEWAKKFLDASIKEYDSYLRGECYCYIVEDEDGNSLNSCCGFIGDIEYVKKEATSAAKVITFKKKEKIEDPNQLHLALEGN